MIHKSETGSDEPVTTKKELVSRNDILAAYTISPDEVRKINEILKSKTPRSTRILLRDRYPGAGLLRRFSGFDAALEAIKPTNLVGKYIYLERQISLQPLVLERFQAKIIAVNRAQKPIKRNDQLSFDLLVGEFVAVKERKKERES